MNKITICLIAIIAVLAGALIAGFFQSPPKDVADKTEVKPLGATPGSSHYAVNYFNKGLVSGGVYATSTSGTAVPFLVSEIEDATVLDVTLNVQDADLTFPASTSLYSLLPNTGDTRTWLVRNASTTAAMDITILTSTGVLPKRTATSTAKIYGDSDGGNFATVTITKKANTDYEALLDFYGDGI